VVDGLERRVRWGLRSLAVASGVAAFAFAFLPETALRMLGWTDAAVVAEVLPWTAFTASFFAAVAVLGAMAAISPRRYAHLLPALGIAFLVAALSLRSSGELTAALAVVAGVVLGSGLFAAYLAFWLDESPSEATLRRDRTILRAVLTALIPASARVALAGSDPRIERAVREAYKRSGRWGSVRLRSVLRAIDAASFRINGMRFEHADAAAREVVLERLLAARHARIRRPVEELRTVALARFYADPRVHAAIGYDNQHLRTRLQQGPNAAAHAANLAAEPLEQETEDPVRQEAEGPTLLAEPGRALRLVRVGPIRS
jgi:hypothetical protein